MKKKLLYPLLLMMIIMVSCSNNSKAQDMMNHGSSNFQADLRDTINLSFKVFSAMNERNANVLASFSSENVTISRDSIEFEYGGQQTTTPYIKDIRLDNLEFRSMTLKTEDSLELAFAKVDNGIAVEIYVQFIKVNQVWKFNGLVTN